MKTSFTGITSGWRNRLSLRGGRRPTKQSHYPRAHRLAEIASAFGLAMTVLMSPVALLAFQTEAPQSTTVTQTQLERLEADLLDAKKDPPALLLLAAGDYAGARDALTPDLEAAYPWLRSYLEGTIA